MTNRLSHFFADRRGAVAIITALALIPLLLATGGAIDFGRITVMRSELQQAVDSAALAAMAAVAQTGAAGWNINGATATRKDDTTPSSVAQNYIEQNFSKNRNLSISTTITPDWVKGTMTVTAKTTVPTFLLGLAGIYSIDIDATATAAAGAGGKLREIAIVFDTTYSMTFEGRAASAAKAATTFIHKVMNNLDGSPNPYVRVALVPFDQYVNVGSKSFWTATDIGLTWLTETDDYSVQGECWKAYQKAKLKCTFYDVQCEKDGIKYTCNTQKCDPTGEYTDIPAGCPDPQLIQWHGCVGSRDKISDEVDRADANNKVSAMLAVYCPTTAIQYLTSNMNSITKAGPRGLVEYTWDKEPENRLINIIKNFEFRGGETYIAQGLLWGWRAISPEKPVAGWDGPDPNLAKTSGIKQTSTLYPGWPYGLTEKIIILMTHGQNTKAASYDNGGHYGAGGYHTKPDPNATEANAKLKNVCNNIKAQGIKIFTIAYVIKDGETKSTLKDCASSASDYFDADKVDDLAGVYRSIGENLTHLRLIK